MKQVLLVYRNNVFQLTFSPDHKNKQTASYSTVLLHRYSPPLSIGNFSTVGQWTPTATVRKVFTPRNNDALRTLIGSHTRHAG